MRPVVRSRIALEGLTIARTVAAALRAPTSRAQGVHRRGARAARMAIVICPPPPAAAHSGWRWRRRGGRWNNSSLWPS